MYSSEFFSLELLREKFENALNISGKAQGFSFSKMWPPCVNFYFLRNVNFFLLDLNSKIFTPGVKFLNLTINILLGAFF